MTVASRATLSAWSAPQQRYESLRKRVMLRSGNALMDLAYANPIAGPTKEIRKALRDAIDNDRDLSLQYTPYGGSTLPRRLVAQGLRKSHGETFKWRHVVLTPGAMSALNILFRTVAETSAEVIVITPCWLDYPLYLSNLGLRPVMVGLREPDFALDLDAIAAAINHRTRAVVLSQPANPTGRIYECEQLAALGELLEGAGETLLISDECHRDVLFDREFISPLSYYDRTCVIYSFGKNLSIQGQRIGYVAVSPRMTDADAFASELEGWCRTMGYCAPTALMQNALPALLRIQPNWSGVSAQRERVITAFKGRGLPIVESDASFFLYCEAGGDDFRQLERLAERDVLVLPSSVFHHKNYFRLSLTSTDMVLDKALPVLLDVIEGLQ